MSVQERRPIHLVVILHGLWGTRDHIAYISKSIQRAAAQYSSSTSTLSQVVTEVQPKGTVSLSQTETKRSKPKVVVLEAAGNEWTNTYDGIDFCAHRVQSEIISTIASLHSSSPRAELIANAPGPNPSVKGYSKAATPADTIISQFESDEDGPWRVDKLSIIGYSLGGLIARYTLGLLENEPITSLFPDGNLPDDLQGREKDTFFDLIRPINFATFATPHIGIPRYKGFGHSFFAFFGQRLLSRTGPQLYAQDKFAPTPESKEELRPMLEVLSSPGTSFHNALKRFNHISIYANVVNDMTVPFPTGSIEETDWFAAAGWNSRKARRDQLKGVGRDPLEGERVAGPDGDENKERYRYGWGNLEWGGVSTEYDPDYQPVLKSYKIIEPMVPPFEKLTEGEKVQCRKLKKSKLRRLLPNVPESMRPSSYPFKPPLNYIIAIFMPVVLPLTILFFIGQFLIHGYKSQGRIRDLKKLEHLSTRQKRLTHLGLFSRISTGVKDAVTEAVDAIQPSENDGESLDTLPPVSPTEIRNALRRMSTSKNADLSGLAGGNEGGYETPPLSSTGGATEQAGSWVPTLSTSQKRMVFNLNTSLKQLKKFYVYFPYLRNAHGAIICRDESFENHQKGKRVVDHLADHFEF